MADLSEVLSSQSVKIAGANPSSGVEDNYLEVDTSGRIIAKMNDGSGNSLASSTTTPAGTEQALIVRNIPSGTQAISAASFPLPTGASTSALQTTGNTSLSSIDTKLPALGQALAATSVPVVLTAAQLTTLTPLSTIAATQSGTWNINNISGTVSLPTGASTSALQTTGNTSVASIDTKTPALGQALAAASVPVVLTAAQITTITPLSTIAVTQSGTWNITNISGTVSLPTGASTETTLAKLTLAQASTTSGQTGPLIQGAVTTASPSYTTAQTSPLSLTTAGALRTDSSATTQPVSGTLNINGAAGTVTHTSGTAGSTSSQALASNSSRKYLMIQNNSTRIMWFALGTTATAAKPSIRLLSNTTFTMESSFISTQAVNAIREGSNDVDFSIVEG